MKILQIVFCTVLMLPIIGFSQCKVKSELLSGKYIGDCKKSFAHGEGTATGTDTYTGAFRKGFPNGLGVYTDANGNVFTGTFKKGKKDGEGKLKMKSSGKEIVGFWKEGQYIGKEKSPYKILQKSAGITTTSFKRTSDRNELVISFTQKGKTLNDKENILLIPLEGNFGNINSNGLSHNVQSVNFPFMGTLRYKGEDLKFRISQPGSWTIKVNFK